MNRSEAFLKWLKTWERDLPALELKALLDSPNTVAVIAQDLLKGFCTVGPLSSPRAASILPAVTDLFQRAYEQGVRHFLLFQDTHDPDAVEFSAFPPHCVAGTEESETVDELANLPFSGTFSIFPKNSISSTAGTDFEAWLDAHPEVTTFILTGVCTDICTYHLAMDLRVRANVLGLRQARIVVPADCVQTYDLPVEAAAEIGALPHDGDLLHRLFLYQMALHDIDVVSHLE
jgi:nicotinamidase-related amidase